jgi:thiopurine S-methyltransferase
MEKSFWEAKWQKNEIGFHRSEPHPMLVKYGERLGQRVYVPLCGKSTDLGFLEASGRETFGTEIVSQAVQDLFSERGGEHVQSKLHPYVKHSGKGRTDKGNSGKALTVLEGNAFLLEPEHLGGPVDSVYDRASLVALDPKTRPQLVASLMRVLPPGGTLLLIVFDYPQAKIPGPPWAVPDVDVRSLFAAFSSVQELETKTEVAGAKFQAAGIREVHERAYWITR